MRLQVAADHMAITVVVVVIVVATTMATATTKVMETGEILPIILTLIPTTPRLLMDSNPLLHLVRVIRLGIIPLTHPWERVTTTARTRLPPMSHVNLITGLQTQSHQAPQTQQSQNNGGQEWRVRKKAKTSQEVEKISLVQVETDKGSAVDFFNVSKGGGRQENFRYEIEQDGTKYQAIKAVKAKGVGENLKRKYGENTLLNVVAWPTPNVSRSARLRSMPASLFADEAGRKFVPRKNDIFAGADAEILPDAEDVEQTNASAPVQIEQVCGMCKKPGHEVIQCWDIGTDGFTHGCAVCNSGEHETDKCQRFPQDVNQRIEILVKRRACLHPLKTAFW